MSYKKIELSPKASTSIKAFACGALVVISGLSFKGYHDAPVVNVKEVPVEWAGRTGQKVVEKSTKGDVCGLIGMISLTGALGLMSSLRKNNNKENKKIDVAKLKRMREGRS